MSTTRRPYTAERQRSLRPGSPPPGAAAAPPVVDGDGATAAILAAIQGLSERMGALETRVEAALPPPHGAAGEAAAANQEEEVEEEEADSGGLPGDLQKQVDEARLLRLEIIALARSIEDTKAEIAKLRDERPEGDRLTVMAHELDAIVGATETATNGILDITEAVSAMVGEIQSQEQDSYIRHLADDIQEKLLGVFEHCNFQDLTGQRITKVVNTMKFIEERIDRMMEIWGRDEFLAQADAPRKREGLAPDHDDDSRLLNGPQTGAAGISQDEIDALFD